MIVRRAKQLLSFSSWQEEGRVKTLPETPAEYWNRHNVTSHHVFSSAEESREFLRWRNAQYPGYIDLMPVCGHDGLSILDYGCGPGHDLVGFSIFSSPTRLVGAEVAQSSLKEAASRLQLHGAQAELVLLNPDATRLPFDDATFDLVHSSGVLHHTADPEAIMREFRRILKPGGKAQIMVYNYDSVWLHLYVAFIKRIAEGQFADLSLPEAFNRTTDGEECPIARPYRASEFAALACAAGFEVEHFGCAVSLWEMSLLPRRFEALMHQSLPAESSDFLASLTFDERGIPLHAGQVAGIDACFRLS